MKKCFIPLFCSLCLYVISLYANNYNYNNQWGNSYNNYNRGYYYDNYNQQYNAQMNYNLAYRLYKMGNLEESLSIFSSLCDNNNNYTACLSAGIVQGQMLDDLDNQKLSRSARKKLKNEYYTNMMSYYTKACNGGNYDACNNLAFYQHSMNDDNKKDEQADSDRTIELYQKACQAGNADACQNLGSLYSSDSNKSNKKETSEEADIRVIQAQNYYSRSCTMGDNVACFNLGVLRYNNAKTASDYAQSIQFFNQACNGDYSAACLNLGIIYERGVTNDIEGDISNAMMFYTKACTLNNADACKYLSNLASKRRKSS